MKETICKRCNIKFNYYPSEGSGNYCSRKCYWGEKVQTICLICNKHVLSTLSRIKDGKGKYCSKSCYVKDGNGRKSGRKQVFAKHKVPFSTTETKSKENKIIEKNSNYNGYIKIHKYISKKFGNPMTCENCLVSDFKSGQIHWANKDHKYRKDREDWIRLCVKCHRAYDRKYNKKSICV